MILYNNTDNMGNFASWESHSLGQYIAPDTDTGRGERGHTVKNHDDAYLLKNLSLFTVEYDHFLFFRGARKFAKKHHF